MAKQLTILFCIVIFLASAYANCPSSCRPNDPSSPRRCVRDAGGVLCILMTECQVRNANCRLRDINRPPLIVTGLSECANLTMNCGWLCSTELVRKPRAIRPNCNQLKCSNASKSVNCYRSRDNRCQLLTQCQLRRINCMRGSQNRLEWDDPRRCAGMKPGQASRKCRSLPKNG